MNYFIRNRNAVLSIYFEVNYFKGGRLYLIIPVERKVQRRSPFSPRLASALWGEASGIPVKRGRRRPHGWQPPAQRWPPEQRRLDPRFAPLRSAPRVYKFQSLRATESKRERGRGKKKNLTELYAGWRECAADGGLRKNKLLFMTRLVH